MRTTPPDQNIDRLREFIEQPWDDPTVGNREAADALAAVSSDLEAASQRYANLQTVYLQTYADLEAARTALLEAGE